MASAADEVAARCGRAVVGALCRNALRDADVRIEGLERVPRAGPTLIVARHVHHALDGCVLRLALPRRLHILVALDWAAPGPRRRLLAWGCRVMRWPAILRPDGPHGAASAGDALPLLRRATGDAVALLRDGGLLLVFPEGYPNVDPHPTPKADLEAWLPFDPGFARLAQLAERDGRTRVAVVPAGFHYARAGDRWRIRVRLDPPHFLPAAADPRGFALRIEARVHALSTAPD